MIKFIKPSVIPIFLLLIQCYLVKNEDINYKDYILNNEVIPTDYKISLDLSKEFSRDIPTYDGVVNIAVKFKDTLKKLTTNQIKLHVKDIPAASIKVQVNKIGNSEILIPNINVNSTVEMLILTFGDDIQLETSEKYNIEITYTGELHNDMYGLYRSEYKDENNETQWIATTQFQATHARRAFPCFDEPALKAKFTIEVKHTTEYHALSNTAIEAIVNSPENGIITTKFRETPKMSTYLIALVVSKFAKIARDNVDNINHGLYSPKEVIGTGQYAFQITPKILNVMEGFTKVSYAESTLGKIDQVAIPDFSAGAMENWGLVTYRETALLWDPAESSSKNKERVATVVAHELAHMWFGNLITLEWWSNTWLNEGFARYYQYHATAEVEKDWELDKQFVVEQQQSVFIADANVKVDALTSDCYTPAQISSKFGTISYNKGASVIRMMEHFMGKSNFLSGIQKYFQNRFFTNTNPSLLWAAMSSFTEDYLQTNFIDIMKSWTEQKGFPVVKVLKANNNSFVSLTQKRFLYGTVDPNETMWYIPITHTTSDNPDFSTTIPTIWLDKTNPIINIPWNSATKWIILNIQASGYYRVHYDDDLYKQLENALKEKDFDTIPVLNRAQIVDDALNLARAGDVKYAVALDVVEYLKEELDYYPWYSAFNAFAYLKRRISSSSELAKLLDQYISLLMTKFYASVEFEEGFYSQIQNHKRVLALTWACELHDNECISNSQERFKMLKEHGVEVDPNIRSVVYCATIRNAETSEDWNYLWNRFETTTSAAESVTILTALGCSKNKAILEKYLDLSIDPESKIRRQDTLSVFTSVLAGNQENVPVALEFLENNFREIVVHYGSLNALSSVITNLADRLTTQEQVNILEKFVEENKDELKDAAVVADTAIISAKDNLRWVQENEKVLVEYLKEKLHVSSASTKSAGLAIGTVFLIIYYYTNDLIFV